MIFLYINMNMYKYFYTYIQSHPPLCICFFIKSDLTFPWRMSKVRMKKVNRDIVLVKRSQLQRVRFIGPHNNRVS